MVQAAMAKDALQKQLRSLGVLSIKEGVNDHADFLHVFRNGELVLVGHFNLPIRLLSG